MTCPAHNLAATRRMLVAEDVDLIRAMVATLPQEPRIVDLGAGSGTTAAAIFAERPYAHVETVDTNLDNLHWAEHFVKANYPDANWRGLVDDSVEAASEHLPESLDMVLIDTSHEYEWTVRELKAWRSKLKPLGLIWCHDYAGDYPGVTRAIDEAVVGALYVPIEAKGLGWGGYRA